MTATLPRPSHTLIALHDRSTELVLELVGRGNTISLEHRMALRATTELLVRMGARHGLTGRWALPAPTGFGKSASIAAYIAALIERKEANERPLLVCQGTVDALGQMREDVTSLLECDVNEHIGIFHTVRHEIRSIEREEVGDYPVLLVPHARLLTGRDLNRYMEHQGARRLVIFDESFMRSEGVGLRLQSVNFGIGGLLRVLPPTNALASFLRESDQRLQAAAEQAAADGHVRYVDLPEVSAAAVKAGVAEAKLQLTRSDDSPLSKEMERFLDVMPGRRIRILPAEGNVGASVLQYRSQVHPDIADVLVFDASYPLRQLCHLDPTLRDAADLNDPTAPFGRLKPLNELKRWERVRLHHHAIGGGFEKVRQDHERAAAEGTTSRRGLHLAKVLERHEGEKVLIVTFKPKQGFDHRAALADELRQLGHDPDHPRLVWMTWGRVTGRNDARECTVVYLASVMMRSRRDDLLPSALGQLDDVGAEVSEGRLRELEQSEAAHEIYQAVSRGRCRGVEGEQALACDLYVTHYSPAALKLAMRMMPGVVEVKEAVSLAEAEADGRRSVAKAEAAHAVTAALDLYPQDTITTSQVKGLVEVDWPANDYTAGEWVRHALESAGWVKASRGRWERIPW